MVLRYTFYSFLAVALLASCAAMPKNTEATSRQVVCGPGPEDMELDSSAGAPRLIISCSQRRESTKKIKYEAFGEIMQYGFDGKPAVAMERRGGPVGAMFNPHGISIAKVDGKQMLYVVNHSKPSPKVKENHIEVYQIIGNTLVHIRTISGPLLISPNDCFATEDGNVYYTNDSGKKGYLIEKLFRAKKSTVYCVTPANEFKLVVNKLAYANGIYVEKRNVNAEVITYDSLATNKVAYAEYEVYVSTVQQKKLLKMVYCPNMLDMHNIEELFPKKNIMPVYGQDNIMRCGDNLVVACHPKPIKFLKHAMDPAKFSPTHVYKLNIKTGEYKCIFVDDGSRVSTGSTAILYKGKLYVSQVFQPYILEVDMPQ